MPPTPAAAEPTATPQPATDKPAAAGAGPLRKRRLWQLPASAHDLLLAMSLEPALLKRSVEQALSRLHKKPCQLLGSPADMLYATIRDLGQRNAVSEALDRLLQARHALATRRMGVHRDEQALQQAWRAELAGPEVAAALWALLTHPLGSRLQDEALNEARAWVFAQARNDLQAAQRRQHTELAQDSLQADCQALRLQNQALQAQKAAQAHAAQLQAAELRGALQREQLQRQQAERELAAWQARRAVDTGTSHRIGGVTAALCAADRPTACAGCATPCRQLRPVPAAHTPDPALAWHTAGAAGLQPPAAGGLTSPPAVAGQRVLCVGGMPGAQARYRALIEAAGGRFAFHDGGLEDGAQRLEQQLGAADLVVCQAGCVNHGAYHRVKGHCRRQCKPCLFVQRPSLASFARTLGLAKPLAPSERTVPA